MKTWTSLLASLACACALASGAPAKEQVKQPAPATAEQLQKLIDQLKSNDFATRQRAADALEKLGNAALPAVRGAAAGGDLEFNRRVDQLVERMDRKRFADLGKWPVCVRNRLNRLLAADPPPDERKLTQVVLVLTSPSVPTQKETKDTEAQLKAARNKKAAVLDLAWSRLEGKKWNDDLESAAVTLDKLRDEVTGKMLADALRLLNDDKTMKVLVDVAAKVAQSSKDRTDPEVMELMMILILARPATEADVRTGTQHLKDKAGKERVMALENIVWALINTKEFCR